jgi:hypothetical protein
MTQEEETVTLEDVAIEIGRIWDHHLDPLIRALASATIDIGSPNFAKTLESINAIHESIEENTPRGEDDMAWVLLPFIALSIFIERDRDRYHDSQKEEE